MELGKMNINDLPKGLGIIASRTTSDVPTWRERLEYLKITLAAVDGLSYEIKTTMFGSYPQEDSHKVPESCIDDVILNACKSLDDIHQTLLYVHDRIN